MVRVNRFRLVLALLAAILILPGVSHAQGGPGVILTDRYVLEAQQIVEGDLVVAAPEIILQPGSRVTGDVALIGQTITIEGQIEGDLAVMAEAVTFGAGARIAGEASLCGGTIRRDDAAAFGSYSASCDRVGNLIGQVAPMAFDPNHWSWDNFDPSEWDFGSIANNIPTPETTPLQRFVFGVGWSLFLGALASLYALIFPQHLRRISDAALSAPVVTAGVGFLSLILAVVITVVLVISFVLIVPVILAPFAVLMWAILFVLALIGWAGLSLPAGTWLLLRLNVRRASPMAAAAAGALVMTLALSLLNLLPWAGILFCGLLLIFASWGLGAVILTQLGRQRYPAPPGARSGAFSPGAQAADVNEFTF